MELGGSDAESHAFGLYILFVFVQPIMIWMKAKAHAKTTGYSTPINLDVSDEQIGVEQAGVTGELKWDQIWKVVRIPEYVYHQGRTDKRISCAIPVH